MDFFVVPVTHGIALETDTFVTEFLIVQTQKMNLQLNAESVIRAQERYWRQNLILYQITSMEIQKTKLSFIISFRI